MTRRGEMQLNTDIINLFLEAKDIMQKIDAYKTPKSRMPQSFGHISALRQLALEAKRRNHAGGRRNRGTKRAAIGEESVAETESPRDGEEVNCALYFHV